MNDDSTYFDVPKEINVSKEFHDSMKLASEFVVIEKPMLLEPGRYVVILGELRRAVFKPIVPLSDSMLDRESWDGGRGSGGRPFDTPP